MKQRGGSDASFGYRKKQQNRLTHRNLKKVSVSDLGPGQYLVAAYALDYFCLGWRMIGVRAAFMGSFTIVLVGLRMGVVEIGRELIPVFTFNGMFTLY